ncbi:DHHC palmitoyltransferase-domain-containing protein [Dendryphion nanum]|uniref:Palmitoyltransferase PFA4 n=1 Tax=Dendryphion nanum TaxID=256645 RepID=A0A9P9ILM7_9PLEO|nr:DHHC palmitoyltransferase-domain-containing protein [Dendryphion nanum]
MELGQLAVPSVYALILFLTFSSQYLFLHLEPQPLTRKEWLWLNVWPVYVLICYTRSVLVDPGRIPNISNEKEILDSKTQNGTAPENSSAPRKWCRKCAAPKPPRAHHCKECGRCIPKMDHHCPWTQNCVSHTTFPHFFRFLLYAVIGMTNFSILSWPRLVHLWQNRDLPSYLGPSAFQMALLFAFTVANSMTLFALSVLLIRNIWVLAVNTTTIEGWEIERHNTLVRRARYFGGYLDGPGGIKVQIRKQEFPYDIGIWKNFKQGMGTGNILAWFFPFAATPTIETGIDFEINDFEDASLSWPPPDPDRLQKKRTVAVGRPEEAFTYRDVGLTPEETLAAFRKRQEEDVVRRRKPFVERVETQMARDNGLEDSEEDDEEIFEERTDTKGSRRGSLSGEEGWRNSEGERLRDFGLDEDVEFYDEEEDLPLSELLARRKAQKEDVQ